MSLQPSRRLRRKKTLQVILNAGRGNVGIVEPIRLPGGEPPPKSGSRGGICSGPVQDLHPEAGSGLKLRETAELGKKEAPGFGLGLTVGANGQMVPGPGFLLRSHAPVQEFLDLFRGQVFHDAIHC